MNKQEHITFTGRYNYNGYKWKQFTMYVYICTSILEKNEVVMYLFILLSKMCLQLWVQNKQGIYDGITNRTIQ